MAGMHLQMNFKTNTAEFVNELRRTGDAVKDISKQMEKAFGAVNTALGAIGVGLSVGAIFTKMIDEAKQAEDASNRITQVLRSTGGVAGVTAQQVDKIAGSLSKLTGIDDDAIKGGQALLLTFKNIGKDAFEPATRAMLDMSAAMGQDMKSSAIQLGKALNDPTEGISALTRVGVTFTQAQKDLIKHLQETGDTLGAQKIILQELESEFGNMSIAARDTLAGAFQALQTSVDNLFEAFGARGSDGLRYAIELAITAVERLSDQVPTAIGAFQELGSVLNLVKTPLNLVIGLFYHLSDSIKLLQEDWKFATDAIGAFFTGFVKQIQTGIKLVIEDFGWLGQAAQGIIKAFQPVGRVFSDASNAIGKFGQDLTSKKGLFGSWFNDFFGGGTSDPAKFYQKDYVGAAFKDFAKGFDDIKKETDKRMAALTAAHAKANVTREQQHQIEAADEKAAKKHDQAIKSLNQMLASLTTQTNETRALVDLDEKRALKIEAAAKVSRIENLTLQEKAAATKQVYELMLKQKELEHEKKANENLKTLKEQTAELRAQAEGTKQQYENAKKLQEINSDPFLSPAKKKELTAAIKEQTDAQDELRAKMEQQKDILAKASDASVDYAERVDMVKQAHQDGTLTMNQYRDAMEKLNAERTKEVKLQDKNIAKLQEETEKLRYKAEGKEKEYDLLKKIREIEENKLLTGDEKSKYIDLVKKETFAQEQLTDRMEHQKEVLQKLSDSSLTYKQKMDLLNDAQQKGILNSKQYGDALQKLNDDRVKQVTKSVKDFTQETLNGFAKAIANGEKLSDVFKNMGKQLALVAANKLLFEPLSNAIGNFAGKLYGGQSGGTSGGGGGLLANLFGGGPGSTSGGSSGGMFGGLLSGLMGGTGTSNKNGTSIPPVGSKQNPVIGNTGRGVLGGYNPVFDDSTIGKLSGQSASITGGSSAQSLGGIMSGPLPLAGEGAGTPPWIWQFAELAPGGWAFRTTGKAAEKTFPQGEEGNGRRFGDSNLLVADNSEILAFARTLVGSSSAGPAWKVINPDCPCPPEMAGGSPGGFSGGIPGFNMPMMGGESYSNGNYGSKLPQTIAMEAEQAARAAGTYKNPTAPMAPAGTALGWGSPNSYLSSQQTQLYMRGLADQSAQSIQAMYGAGLTSYGQVQNYQGAWNNALATQAAQGYRATPNYLQGLNGGNFNFAGGTGMIGTQLNIEPESSFVPGLTGAVSGKSMYAPYNYGNYGTQQSGSLLSMAGGQNYVSPQWRPQTGNAIVNDWGWDEDPAWVVDRNNYTKIPGIGTGGSNGLLPFNLSNVPGVNNPLNSTMARWGMNTRAKGGELEVGIPTIVGEEGREMIIPQRPGNVVPHPTLMQMLEGSGGKGGAAPQVLINNNGAPVAVSNQEWDGQKLVLTLEAMMSANQRAATSQALRTG